MKTQSKIIIVLSVLLSIAVSSLIFTNIYIPAQSKKTIAELKEKNEKYAKNEEQYKKDLAERDKDIEALKKKPPEVITKVVTVTEIQQMTDPEKERMIIGLQKDKETWKKRSDDFEAIVNSDTILFTLMMNDLNVLIKEDLPDAIKSLKTNSWKPRIGIEISEQIGIDSRISFLSITSLGVKGYLLNGRFYVGGNIGLIIEKDLIDLNGNVLFNNDDSTKYGAVVGITLGFNL